MPLYSPNYFSMIKLCLFVFIYIFSINRICGTAFALVMVHEDSQTKKKSKMNNAMLKTNKKINKGFTLIELIMVTIILGILAAVAIPRYVATVTRAEQSAEDAVISNIKSGLETFATEQLMEHGRRMWPGNPFHALETTPDGFSGDSSIANEDGEWDFNGEQISHMRGDNSVYHWHYSRGNTGTGTETSGSLSVRYDSNDYPD